MTCGLLTTQGYSASAYSCGGSYGIELNNSHHIPIHIQKCNEMLSKATLAAIVNKVNHRGQEMKGSGVGENTHLIQWVMILLVTAML